jgi:hypothetical protein
MRRNKYNKNYSLYTSNKQFIVFLLLTLSLLLILFTVSIVQRVTIPPLKAYTINSITPFVGSPSAPLKILFINLNKATYFNAVVNEIVNVKMKTNPPFANNYNYISFYKINLQVDKIENYCSVSPITGSSGYECDSKKIFSLIRMYYPGYNHSNFLNIAVLNGIYAGSAGSIITLTIDDQYDKPTAVRISSKHAIHEIGHEFGLGDYAIGPIKNDGSPNLIWNQDFMYHWYNIDQAGCPKWCQSYKPVNQYTSSECLTFTTKAACIAYNRPDCSGDNCCVWSDTKFDYFNSNCVPWSGSENIGINCLNETGCYFGAAYSHYAWKPTANSFETIMMNGYGDFDSVSQRQILSVFKCCMNSNYSSPLTQNLDCSSYKQQYQDYLKNYSFIKKMGYCDGRPNSSTPTPTSIPSITPSPNPTPP